MIMLCRHSLRLHAIKFPSTHDRLPSRSQANYGKDNEECIAKIKALYEEVGIKKVRYMCCLLFLRWRNLAAFCRFVTLFLYPQTPSSAGEGAEGLSAPDGSRFVLVILATNYL